METKQLFAGLDMHSGTTTGTIKNKDGNVVRSMKVNTSSEGIKTLFNRVKKKDVKAVFEANAYWVHFYKLLRPYCGEIIMAHPRKVKAIASAKVKTDSIDSNTLTDLLRGNLIPQSFMPELDIMELRELARYRAKLSGYRAQLKVKIRDIISKEGGKCESTEISGPKAKVWLKHFPMSDLNRQKLDFYMGLIDKLDEEIKDLDKKFRKKKLEYPETELLESIPGLSTYSALLILAEIADISRFDTPDKLASYAGLVPSTYQSSDTQFSGNITREGSKWLRWILVQCTHSSIASSKNHKLKQFYMRLKRRVGTTKAITATARKMLVIIWYLVHKNEFYVY